MAQDQLEKVNLWIRVMYMESGMKDDLKYTLLEQANSLGHFSEHVGAGVMLSQLASSPFITLQAMRTLDQMHFSLDLFKSYHH